MFSLPFRIAEYIGRKKRNGMTLFAYAFYTLFCLSRYMPIRQICEDYRVTVSAMGLIAYVLNDRWTQFIFMLCWFYLIGDGPFFDCTIQYVLLRSGRIKWATVVFLFVLLSAAYFLLWAAVLCVVCAFPYVNFQTEWDSVIRSLAAIRTLGQNYHAYFIFTPYIHMNYSVLQAFGWSLSLHFLLLVAFGMFVSLFNSLSKQQVGILIAGMFLIMDMSAYQWFASDYYYFYSPLSLVTLNVLDLHGTTYRPTPDYSLCFFGIAILLITTLFLLIMHRRSIVAIKHSAV